MITLTIFELFVIVVISSTISCLITCFYLIDPESEVIRSNPTQIKPNNEVHHHHYHQQVVQQKPEPTPIRTDQPNTNTIGTKTSAHTGGLIPRSLIAPNNDLDIIEELFGHTIPHHNHPLYM